MSDEAGFAYARPASEVEPQAGLTKREYFAIRLMCARVTFEKRERQTWGGFCKHEAQLAVHLADALLEEFALLKEMNK